jgi:hypothetical protein
LGVAIKPLAGDFAVVRWLQVAATGDQDGIARAGLIEREVNRFSTMGNYLRLVGPLEPIEYIVRSSQRHSVRRLMAGDDAHVRPALDDASEQGTPRGIGFFSRTENDENSAAGNLSQRLNRQRQRLRRTGGIDKHAERLPALQPLHTAGDAIDRFQAADDCFQIKS